MATSPDPVEDPRGYQRFLLNKLGDDDPAEVQAATPPALREVFERAEDRLRTAPASGEWSALETAGHMLDAEVIASARYRWILSEHEPPLVGYDQELWMRGLRHHQDDPAVLLSAFESMRAANLDLWVRSPEQERARIGLHSERGPESYDLTFRLIAGHDRNHLDQALRAAGA